MKYLSLETVGFKRFGLNNIERFSIVFNEPTQLILGINGSGKSSLIGELSPLPADPAAYTKEGSKTIKISHLGRDYTLRSWFSPSSKHSFKCGDEELNEGGTAGAQTKLAWEHFHYTAAIHKLLLGHDIRERFCTMSPMKRREWFTALSDVSYDYALGIFKKLQERLRDTTGALKMARRNLVAETAKTLAPAEEERLRLEVGEISAELNVLLAERAPVRRTQQSIEQEIASGFEELQRLSTRLLRTRFIAPYGYHPNQPERRNDWGELERPSFSSTAELAAVINEYREQAAGRQALLSKSVEEHAKIQETVNILQRTGEAGIQAQITKLRVLQEERGALVDRLTLGLITPDPVNALSALDTVSEMLQAIFLAIPSNEDRRYSTAKLEEAEVQLRSLQDQKRQLSSDLSKLESQRQHAESHKKAGSLTCPSCSFQWSTGYSEERYQALLEQIANQESLVRAMEVRIKDQESSIESIREYAEFFRDYVRTVRSWPVLQPLWDHLANQSLVQNSPRSVLPLLVQYRADLLLETEIHQIEARQRELQTLIEQAAQVGDANLAEQTAKLEEAASHIEVLTLKLATSQAAVRDFSHYRTQLTDAEGLVEEMVRLRQHLNELLPAAVETLRLTTIEHCVKQLQHSLVRKEETLAQVTLQKGIIEALEKQIAQLTVEEVAARHLVHELSPTDGLIAEGLMGFIRSFTSQMNAIIRKVWTYPMVVQDCGTVGEQGAELDYKFPLMIQTKTNVSPDVADSSEGQKEFINFAFQLVAMRHLGLSDYPLFVDEFPRAMDVEHRLGATNLVKSLIEQHTHSQLFMVSHNYHQYGAFSQLETCVLDPRNVVVPDRYNEHVTIS